MAPQIREADSRASGSLGAKNVAVADQPQDQRQQEQAERRFGVQDGQVQINHHQHPGRHEKPIFLTRQRRARLIERTIIEKGGVRCQPEPGEAQGQRRSHAATEQTR